ncbi:MAG: hypothetical protein WA741_21525, partial [Candidatus Sulfotelmatobacter sp.]
DEGAAFLAMPIRPFKLRQGGCTIGAFGYEHLGAPLDHESSDGRAVSMGGTLSDITGGHDLLMILSILTVSQVVLFLQNDCARYSSHWDLAMTSPTETALTFVVVKSLAIVGSAFAAVLFLAVVGAKRG